MARQLEISRSDQAAARTWLTQHGHHVGRRESLSKLSNFVQSLDPSERRRLSGYLRLRRHRAKVGATAVELPRATHDELTSYANRAGVTLAGAIELLLSDKSKSRRN